MTAEPRSSAANPCDIFKRVATSVEPVLLVVGGTDGAVRVLAGNTLETVARVTVDSRVSACALSHHGRTAMIGDDNGRVHFFRVDTDSVGGRTG